MLYLAYYSTKAFGDSLLPVGIGDTHDEAREAANTLLESKGAKAGSISVRIRDDLSPKDQQILKDVMQSIQYPKGE